MRIFPTILFALPLLLGACEKNYSYDFSEISEYQRDKKKAPLENAWNALGVWKRVSDSPAVYIPAGYPVAASRSSSAGAWYVDERDGKRLFVPKGGVSGMEEQLLRNDAIKNSRARRPTNWGEYQAP